MQQTRYSRMRTESCVNHHKKHGDIARCRFSDSKQTSSKYCCYGKTSNVIRSDFAANARCSRVERMENPDELIIGTSLLEVDSCKNILVSPYVSCLATSIDFCLFP